MQDGVVVLNAFEGGRHREEVLRQAGLFRSGFARTLADHEESR